MNKESSYFLIFKCWWWKNKHLDWCVSL